MNDITENLLYSPEELEKWFDDTSVPLSDDDIKSMSAYFDSESFQFTNSNFCDIMKSNQDDKEQTKLY